MNDLKNRYYKMLDDLGLDNEKVSKITGNTPESIRAVVNYGEFPRWLKLALFIHEKKKKK